MDHKVVGIISLGDMGCGVARLLQANDFEVITTLDGRSQATRKRAEQNGIRVVTSDLDLCNEADYILSIVPPKDAITTAERIITAVSHPDLRPRTNALYFLDLNATSPKTARHIASFFRSHPSKTTFLDGGIIGGPPQCTASPTASSTSINLKDWYRPSIVVSGSPAIDTSGPSGSRLATAINLTHLNDEIGSATGLKMCFASLSKGFTALAIASYTTAARLGVLDHLNEQLDLHSPGVRERAARGLVGMPPKAYRWVAEMEEIVGTMEDDGEGFMEDESIFRSIARLYALVADGTKLGEEKVGERIRGLTAADVADLMVEGLHRRKDESKK